MSGTRAATTTRTARQPSRNSFRQGKAGSAATLEIASRRVGLTVWSRRSPRLVLIAHISIVRFSIRFRARGPVVPATVFRPPQSGYCTTGRTGLCSGRWGIRSLSMFPAESVNLWAVRNSCLAPAFNAAAALPFVGTVGRIGMVTTARQVPLELISPGLSLRLVHRGLLCLNRTPLRNQLRLHNHHRGP